MRALAAGSVARFLVAGSVALVGCTGLETGNPQTGDEAGEIEITLALVGAQASMAFVAEDADGVPFELDAARAHVTEIVFDLPPGEVCEGFPNPGLGRGGDARWTTSCTGRKVRVAGPWVIDLVAGVSEPPLATVEVLPGRYAGMEVRFAPADPDDGLVEADDPLVAQSFVAAGVFPLDGDATPFRLALSFTEDVAFASEAGIDVAPGALERLVLGLDVRTWLTGSPIARCVADGDLTLDGDTVVLDNGTKSCAEVRKTVRQAIAGSARLERAGGS